MGSGSGFFGGGYLKFKDKSDSAAEFSIFDCDEGDHYIELTYRAKKKETSLDLFVNDELVFPEVEFEKTGGKKQPFGSSPKMTVSFSSKTSVNTITVKTTGDNKGPLLDSVVISQIPTFNQLKSCEGLLGATSTTFLHEAKAKNGDIKYKKKDGYIEWQLEDCLPGTYALSINYKQKKKLKKKRLSLSVGETQRFSIDFIKNSAGKTAPQEVLILEGINNIRLSAYGTKAQTVFSIEVTEVALDPFETSFNATDISIATVDAAAVFTSTTASIVGQEPIGLQTVTNITDVVALKAFTNCTFGTAVVQQLIAFPATVNDENVVALTVQYCSDFEKASGLGAEALRCYGRENEFTLQEGSFTYELVAAVCESGGDTFDGSDVDWFVKS